MAGELLAAGEQLYYQDLVYSRQVAERATGAPGESSGTSRAGADSCVVEVAHRDGRTWRVALENKLFDGVVASCGKNPATKPGWAVTDLVAS